MYSLSVYTVYPGIYSLSVYTVYPIYKLRTSLKVCPRLQMLGGQKILHSCIFSIFIRLSTFCIHLNCIRSKYLVEPGKVV